MPFSDSSIKRLEVFSDDFLKNLQFLKKNL